MDDVTYTPVNEQITNLEEVQGKAYVYRNGDHVELLYVMGRSYPRSNPETHKGKWYKSLRFDSRTCAIRLDKYTTPDSINWTASESEVSEIPFTHFLWWLLDLLSTWSEASPGDISAGMRHLLDEEEESPSEHAEPA